MASRGLKKRLANNLRKISPALAFRLGLKLLVFLPGLAVAAVRSFWRIRRWRDAARSRLFIARNRLAFEGIDESTLVVEAKAGGVLNSNQIWSCRDASGKTVRYFVKIFLPMGSFWAKHLSELSPFPAIRAGGTHERFTADLVGRAELAALGIAVPRLVAFDAVEKLMVTEWLDGSNVDELLARIASRPGLVEEEDRHVVRLCATELARVHEAGFSLIDTQPVNCIWVPTQGKVYFTDLEFCTREDRRVWDVGFFLCFLALRFSGEKKKVLSAVFVENYRSSCVKPLRGVGRAGADLKEYLPVLESLLDVRRFTPEDLLSELSS
ncbi:MAG TPA: hypothetical protein VL404_08245 [Candidatus Eisenbacteria bacterium]|nr:hypothetical protein [Candidatus Eisenbacteria bacterium]